MENRVKFIAAVVIIAILLVVGNSSTSAKTHDSWHNYDGTEIVCRRNGCGKKPLYSDWNRRYCSTHINDTHYCRYPNCMNEISNRSGSRYCYLHD